MGLITFWGLCRNLCPQKRHPGIRTASQSPRYTSHGPHLIEVNARMGGGQVYETNWRVWGVDLVEELRFFSHRAQWDRTTVAYFRLAPCLGVWTEKRPFHHIQAGSSEGDACIGDALRSGGHPRPTLHPQQGATWGRRRLLRHQRRGQRHLAEFGVPREAAAAGRVGWEHPSSPFVCVFFSLFTVCRNGFGKRCPRVATVRPIVR